MDKHTYILALLEKDKLDQAETDWLLTHEADLRQIVQEQFILDLKSGQMPPTALATAKLRQLQATIDHTSNKSVENIPAIVRPLKTALFRYAAILLILAGIGTVAYFYIASTPSAPSFRKNPGVTKVATDIQPGGSRATLTLADGSIIILDSAADGSLARQGGTKILKLNAGSLAYEAGDTNGPVLYNTISTPNGGQYQITLPDDTKVWLNAASSVRFPTAFAFAREVEITGEAYLEVATDKNKPFRVKTSGTVIDVLGTGFNVNAYNDEPALKVSLESGSIKIGTSILKPGQAYYFGKLVSTDLEQDLAWKHGVFNFNNKPFAEVMRQLERWYDIKVIYEKGIPTIQLAGEMTKDVPLKGMLVGLEKLGLKARLEGRQLFVAR